MIQYNKYKRFYAEPGLFTLSGSSYEGYVEVLSGSPYVSNTLDILTNKCNINTVTTRVPLQKATTYRTDLLCSDFFYDRYISDSSQLPISLEDILIQPNDFLNYGLISEKLDLLNTNTTYTYSRCLLPNNKLPNNLENVKFASINTDTKTTFSIVSEFQDSILFSSSPTFVDIGSIKGFTVINNIDDENKSVIFAFSDTKLISLSCDDTNISIIEISPYYVSNTIENILTFSNIGGVVCVDTNLFVTDTGNNNIIKYDIGGYINNDITLSNKRNLTEIVGGKGQARDNLLFNAPTVLATDGKHVAVYDSGNFIIKVFDTDLNFIARISGVNLRTEQFITFEYNTLTGLLYILTQTTTGIKIYIIDDHYNIANIYTSQLVLDSLEVIKNITFSLSDSNYFYICTNFSIYKLLVNRPEYIFGRLASSRFYTNIVTTDIVTPGITTTLNFVVGSLWNYTNVNFNESSFIWNIDNIVPYDSVPPFDTFANGWWNYNNTPHQDNAKEYVDTNFADADYYWNVVTLETSTTNTITAPTSSTITTSTIYRDPFIGLHITPQTTNFDRVFFVTGSRIYYFNEQHSLNTVLKEQNFENFGNKVTLSKEEYIQSSSINKELYKVARDIIELKNNIIGRFTGVYDERNIFTYTDYNYNINLSEIYNRTPDNYYIHDNEKNILGVINRVITEIYTLQEQLIKLTAADFGDDLAPVFNYGSNQPSNVLIIE
jgi:hypothetical protein